MVSEDKVTLAPALKALAVTWSLEDQDVFLGFVDALNLYGFDLIGSALARGIEGFTVEFVEPGETPDMVWARVFIDLETQCVAFRVDQTGDQIFLQSG